MSDYTRPINYSLGENKVFIEHPIEVYLLLRPIVQNFGKSLPARISSITIDAIPFKIIKDILAIGFRKCIIKIHCITFLSFLS